MEAPISEVVSAKLDDKAKVKVHDSTYCNTETKEKRQIQNALTWRSTWHYTRIFVRT